MFSVLGGGIALVGIVLYFVAVIGVLIQAFQEHILWGLACFFFQLPVLIFVLLHWDKAGKYVLYWFGGILLAALGAGIASVG